MAVFMQIRFSGDQGYNDSNLKIIFHVPIFCEAFGNYEKSRPENIFGTAFSYRKITFYQLLRRMPKLKGVWSSPPDHMLFRA